MNLKIRKANTVAAHSGSKNRPGFSRVFFAIHVLSIFCLVATVMPIRAQANLFETIKEKVLQIDEQKKDESGLEDLELINGYVQGGDAEAPVTDTDEGVIRAVSGPLRLSTEPEVFIPNNSTISIYTVKQGDTLNGIAELFGVSVNTIVWANNLDARKAIPGQVLTILPITGTKHIVVAGDTVDSLAKKYEADSEDIALYNGIERTAKLVVGETILVPDGNIAVPKKEAKENDKKKITDNIKKKAKDSKAVKSVTKIVKNLSRSGYFVRPISGGVRTTGLHGNNAVDLAAPVGTSIYAAADGKVITVKTGGYNGGYGNYVVISHDNGTQTLYAHNSSNYVSPGQRVSQGQTIAAVGSTGKSTGPHVHFEVRGGRNPF